MSTCTSLFIEFTDTRSCQPLLQSFLTQHMTFVTASNSAIESVRNWITISDSTRIPPICSHAPKIIPAKNQSWSHPWVTVDRACGTQSRHAAVDTPYTSASEAAEKSWHEWSVSHRFPNTQHVIDLALPSPADTDAHMERLFRYDSLLRAGITVVFVDVGPSHTILSWYRHPQHPLYRWMMRLLNHCRGCANPTQLVVLQRQAVAATGLLFRKRKRCDTGLFSSCSSLSQPPLKECFPSWPFDRHVRTCMESVARSDRVTYIDMMSINESAQHLSVALCLCLPLIPDPLFYVIAQYLCCSCLVCQLGSRATS